MLCHAYELRHEISVFMEKKGAEVLAFADSLLLLPSLFRLNAATTEIRKSKRSYEQKLACNTQIYSKRFLCICQG